MKKNKLNVVWLHSHFLFWMGGTKFVHHVVQELQKRPEVGRVLVVVEDASDFAREKYRNTRVELISLNSATSTSPWYWLFLPFFLGRDVVTIKNILASQKLDPEQTVVISGMFPLNVVAYFLGFRHIQNCFEPFAFFYDSNFIAQFSFAKRSLTRLLGFLYAPLDRWAVRKADVVLTLNSTTQARMAEVYGVSSQKTQAGVDSQLFKPYVSPEIQKKHRGKKIAIHSTDYSPVKGTDLVIKAFARVVRRVPNALLLITTTIDDPERRQVYQDMADKLGIGQQVLFLGFLPIAEVPQYYSLATVMVQGAFSEKSGTTSMSLPVKEAMCCETPAIRPDTGGEDVIDGVTGYLVDPRNTTQMAKKITRLFLDEKLAKKMGQRARKDIVAKYTWENTAQSFLDAMRSKGILS